VSSPSPASPSVGASPPGLAYNTAEACAPLIREGRLEACLEPFLPENPGLFVYFPSRAQVLPKLRAFLDFWRENS
jgi:DNA-binding transcriptional LysR family regulator